MATKMFEELTTERQPSPEPEVRIVDSWRMNTILNPRLSLRWRRSLKVKLSPCLGSEMKQLEAGVGEMSRLQGI